MKKILFLGIVIILIISIFVIFLLAGCKTEEVVEDEPAEEAVEDEPAEEAAEEMVTLQVMVWEGDYTKGMQAQFDAMEDKYNIKTEVELTPADIGYTIINSRVATGEMPDILEFNSGALLQTLNPPNNFVDISDQTFVDKFSSDFKTAVTIDGGVYGVPSKYAGVGGIIYNKDIYEELGLDIPLTWSEFIANCNQVEAAGYIPILGSFGDNWTAQLLVLADYYNVNALEPNFADDFTVNKVHCSDSQAMLRSFEKLWEAKDLMNDDFITTTYDDALRLLSEGNFAHWPMLNFALQQLSANYPEAIDSVGMFPEPSDDPNINGFTSWASNTFILTNQCSDMEAGMKWLEFMTTQEAIDVLSTKEIVGGPLSIMGLDLPENTMSAVFEIQEYFNEGKSSPALEFLSPVKGPNLPAICVEVGSGMVTPLEGAEACDEDVKAQAQQLDLEGW